MQNFKRATAALARLIGRAAACLGRNAETPIPKSLQAREPFAPARVGKGRCEGVRLCGPDDLGSVISHRVRFVSSI